ncbi:MAG: tyrosine-type recombinase/integrase [Acidimicrobiales bacterium]
MSDQTAARAVCAGANRFGRRCTNQVDEPGGWCGKCQPPTADPPPGSNPAAPSQATAADRAAPGGPVSGPPAADEQWTPAAEIRRRLSIVAGPNPELQRLVEVSARLAANSRARNTKATYQQHWATFERFCVTAGLPADLPVPAEVVCLFLGFLTVYRRADRTTGQRTQDGKPLSHGFLRQAVAAIGYKHRLANQPDPSSDPTVTAILDGYGKTYGTATHGKDPLRIHQLGAICLALTQPPATAARDLALVLLATDQDLNLGPGQLARLDRHHIQLPDTPLDPAVLLVGRRGGPALHPVEVWPNPLTDICPVRALIALLNSHTGDAVFATSDGKPVTLEGVVWITTSLVRQAGLTPARLDRRVPRSDVDQRLQVAAALGQPASEDLRDRAIITSLYWGCFRGEEVAGTSHHQLRRVDQGIEWTLPRAKNDQLGQGKTRGLPANPDPWVCPVTAIDDWAHRLERLHGRPLQVDDPLFPALVRPGRYNTPISRAAIGEIIQRAVTRAGIKGNYGSHSPRAGFTTDALDAGATREHVQTYGGWQNAKSLDSYYRRTNIWGTTNPASRLTRLDD